MIFPHAFAALGYLTFIALCFLSGLLMNNAVRATLRRMWRARHSPPPPPWPDLPIPPEGVVELMFQVRLGEKIIDGERRAIWLTKNYKGRADILRFMADPQPVGVFVKKLANNWPTLSAEADTYHGPHPNGRPEDQAS